ncbi:MAG: hypothetical protein IKQ31_03775 [Clostridia bacterium]|nr:hypothetical protein [Clostridia bacterium]
MGILDDWKALDKLQKDRDKIVSRYQSKKFRAKSIVPTFGGLACMALSIIRYNNVNSERRAAIKPEVDKFAADVSKEIDIEYGYDKALYIPARFLKIDSSNAQDYLREKYFWAVYNGNTDPDVIRFCEAYENHKFDYLKETMDAMYDSVYYPFSDAVKDVLPAVLGATAIIGTYYAYSVLKYRHQLDSMNKAIYKLEDKLFWDK